MAGLLIGMAVAPSDTRADALPEHGWMPLSIGVLPARAYDRASSDLSTASSGSAALAEIWRKRVSQMLSQLDELRVADPATVLRRLREKRDFAAQLRLGKTYQKLGLDSFEAVQQTRARELLDRALETLLQVHGDMVEPRRVADVQFFRGLALLEAGRHDAAHVAFRAMFVLDPGRTFKDGYYGKRVEDALRLALGDVWSQADPARLQHGVERLVDLGQRARVLVVAVLSVVGTRSAPILKLRLFDVRSRGVQLSARVPLSGPSDPTDALNRLLTSWHACHVAARVKNAFVVSAHRPGVFVEVGYTHTLMLEHATRSMFHSPGAFIGVTWEPSPNVVVFGRTVQMVSLPDANTDLLKSFMTSRLAFGVGLAGGSRTIRGYLEAGLEAGFAFNDIELSRDVDCKHFGPNHDRCSGVSTFEAPSIWFGFVVGASLRWRVVKSWYMRAAVDASLYIADTALVRTLNFPLSISVGIGNRF